MGRTPVSLMKVDRGQTQKRGGREGANLMKGREREGGREGGDSLKVERREGWTDSWDRCQQQENMPSHNTVLHFRLAPASKMTSLKATPSSSEIM